MDEKQPVQASPEQASPPKARKSSPETWKKNVNRTKCRLGEAFTDRNGRERPAKSPGVHNPQCKMRCFEKVPESKRTALFETFWSKGSYQLQNEYLAGFRHKKELSDGKRKSSSSSFHINVDGERQRVCMSAICAIFGFSRKRIENLDSNLEKGETRGGSRKKLTAQVEKSVTDHIKAFPKHKDHYGEKNHPHRLYIDEPGIRSVASMHRDYLRLHLNKPSVHCIERNYRSVFKRYNLGFKPQRSDDCTAWSRKSRSRWRTCTTWWASSTRGARSRRRA